MYLEQSKIVRLTYVNVYSMPTFRCLQDQDVLQGAMLTLDEEIVPWDDPSEASTEYRKQLTKSLLYKVFGSGTYNCYLFL